MRWKKFRLQTRTEAEDLVICALADAGVEGAEIEDKVPLSESDRQQMFVDILPDSGEDDGVAYLSFYLDEDADEAAILKRVEEELEALRAFTDIGPCTVEKSLTEDKDWINNWKEYFHQFYVDDMLVIPSWEEMKDEDRDKLVIHIDPGTAFGTGMHETTQLCMRQIRKYLHEGDEVLDVGTGSGILSIVALKLGAGHALGTDLDTGVVDAVKENLEANGIAPEQMELLIGNLIDDAAVQAQVGEERYDLVTANILAEILVPLMPAAARCMKRGAVIITSGILCEKEQMVADACVAAGLTVLEVTTQGEWCSVTAQRP